MIIAFMGNDGSGKTTIAKEFVGIFSDLGFKVIYRHEHQYTILKFLFGIIGMERVQSERKRMIAEKRESWKYILWPYLVWFDIFMSMIYFKLLKRREVVIMDRYFYDSFVSFKYLGCLTRTSEWLYLHSPKPDMGFILRVEPQIAYIRKRSTHTYCRSFYEKQTRSYLQLAKVLGIRAIDTDKKVSDVIDEALEAFQGRMLNAILRKGVQNGVLFSVMKKYRIASSFSILARAFERRRERLETTLSCIKDFFEKNGIRHYSIVKTLRSDTWIGNDVDVIVTTEEFNRIVNMPKSEWFCAHCSASNPKPSEKGKIDIRILSSLPIDLHSYVGWRNNVLISSQDVLKKECLVRGLNDLYFANNQMNSVIIALTHVFEKGFVTLNEYHFLKDHFNPEFLKDQFPRLHDMISDYIHWIERASNSRQQLSYPIFVPMSIIVKCYFQLLFFSRDKCSDIVWKLRAFIRDIAFMAFWRVRYTVKSKLPFEVTASALQT